MYLCNISIFIFYYISTSYKISTFQANFFSRSKSEKLFNRLKPLHPFYFDLEIIGKDETGLLFACKNLDENTKMCKIHKKRAKICRDYPMEEILKMGGTLAEGCGYRFEPIEKFSEVLNKAKKQNSSKIIFPLN